MEVGETRKFEVDKNVKKGCKLPGEGIIEIQIKKEQPKVWASEFRMVSPKADDVFINCDDGYIDKLQTRGIAENCGIGKILMQLCLNENEIHNVANNDKNGALNQIDKYITDCNKKESCNEIAQAEIAQLEKLREWIPTHCSKLILLEMQAKPRSTAHVYFNSAKAAGFKKMFMIDHVWLWYEPVNFYPKKGPCPVKMLQKRYSEDGYMVDGKEKTLVWGMNWFFCYPKKVQKISTCTIL